MRYSNRIRLAILCILSAVSSSLYASNTVVLIDQAGAAAGNITPGDAPGFPVTLSQPGSYRLVSNLVVTGDVSAIQITADNVTIDLNGYSIIGPNLCSNTVPATCKPAGTGIGVQAGDGNTVGPTSVKVFNGSIRGMGLHGIQLTGLAGLVERVSADGNAGSGLIVNGSVVESSATGNGADGIRALIVRDSISVGNRSHGIFLTSGGVASGNAISLNGFRGIFARNGSVIGNTVTGNVNIGILASCPSSVVDNTSFANTGTSIVADGQNCTVVNNATSQ